MGFLNSLLNAIGTGIQNANANAQSGYDKGSWNVERISDDELRRKIKSSPSSSMKGYGEYKAYLDEGKRRGIIK